eukprot:948974-Prymnesium_polylepis.1
MEGDGGYPTITVDGKQKKFHLVVFDAFFPGVRGDRTIDHINRDPFDNRLSNLRPVTWSEQMRNRTLKPPSERQNSQKTRLRYRRADAPDHEPWKKCRGAGELARRLTHATGKIYRDSNISKAAIGKYGRGTCKNPHRYKDYVFYKV